MIGIRGPSQLTFFGAGAGRFAADLNVRALDLDFAFDFAAGMVSSTMSLGGTMGYTIHTDVKYRPLELVDAGRLADTCPDKWWNQTLCQVNDSVARLGVFEGEFHWHKHDREDEFFFVLEGKLLLDLEGRTVELEPRQGI